MNEESKRVLEEALYDLEATILLTKNIIIDMLIFDCLTQENKIPELINACNRCDVSRYDLIDDLKDIMVQIILEAEIESKELEDIEDKDVELIPVDFLVKWMEHEDRIRVIELVKKKYPNLISDLNNQAIAISNDEVFKMVAKTISFRGRNYD